MFHINPLMNARFNVSILSLFCKVQNVLLLIVNYKESAHTRGLLSKKKEKTELEGLLICRHNVLLSIVCAFMSFYECVKDNYYFSAVSMNVQLFVCLLIALGHTLGEC